MSYMLLTWMCLSMLIHHFHSPVSQTVVDCGGLEDPPNGTVTFSVTTYESVANYSCSAGYNLNGDSSRICLNTSEWSGSRPHCSSKYSYHISWIFLSSSSSTCFSCRLWQFRGSKEWVSVSLPHNLLLRG